MTTDFMDAATALTWALAVWVAVRILKEWFE